MEKVNPLQSEANLNDLGLNQDLLLNGYDPNKLTNYSLTFKGFKEASLRQWVLDYIDPPLLYTQNWRSLELISEYCFNLNALEQINGQPATIDEASQVVSLATGRPAIAMDSEAQTEIAQIVWRRIICDTVHCLLPETIDSSSWRTGGHLKIPAAMTDFLNDRESSTQANIINLKLEELLANCQTIVGHYLREAQQHIDKLAVQANYWTEIVHTTEQLIKEDIGACQLEPEANHHTPDSYSNYILSCRRNSRLPYNLEHALQMTTFITSLSQEAKAFISDIAVWMKLLQRAAAPTAPARAEATVNDGSDTLSQADSVHQQRLGTDQAKPEDLSQNLIDDWQANQRQHAANLWQLRESFQAWRDPNLQPTTLIDDQSWVKCQVYTDTNRELTDKIDTDILRQHANLRLLSCYWRALASSCQLNSSFQLQIHHQLQQLGHLKI